MENETQNEEKPLSALDESKKILAEIEKQKIELKEWTERAEAVRSEQMLSGNADAGTPAEAPKKLTPREYAEKVMAGEVPK